MLINKENFKKSKKSIVSIQNTDTMCLPRAIVVARMQSKKHQDPQETYSESHPCDLYNHRQKQARASRLPASPAPSLADGALGGR